MALYTIEFKHTEIYYHDETVEAGSVAEAERIARRLLDAADFEEHLMDCADYDDHEDSFIQAYEVERVTKYGGRQATMTAEEIEEYLGED